MIVIMELFICIQAIAVFSASVARIPAKLCDAELEKSRYAVKPICDVRESPVVLVNCQLAGGAHEGQPGFTLVFAKAVLLHQWIQSVGWVWSQSSCARCS